MTEERLLEIARATGLRGEMHGTSPTYAKALLGKFLAAVQAEANPTPHPDAAFHVSRVGMSSQFGGDTFTIKAHFNSREQAELAKRFLEQCALAVPGDDKALLELIGKHCLLRDETEGRWFFNFPGYADCCVERSRS